MEIQCVRLYEENNYFDLMNVYNPNKNLTCREMEHYLTQLGNRFIIVGDFNAHSSLLSSRDMIANTTGRTIENLVLNQNVCLINPRNMFTYLNMSNGARSCLDLCLTSANLALLTNVGLLEDIDSDHTPMSINIDTNSVYTNIIYRRKWKVNQSNLPEFSNNVKSTTLQQPNSVNTLVEDLTKRIVDSADQHIGLTSGKPREGKIYPWWDIECKRSIAKKRYAKKLLERHPTSQNLINYTEKNKETGKIIDKKRKDSFKDFVSSISHDMPIGTVWEKFRRLKGIVRNLNPPLLDNGNIVTNPLDKANTFVGHFENNAKENNHKTINNLEMAISRQSKIGMSEVYNSDITMPELKKELACVKNTSPGHDNISYSLIKNLKPKELIELINIYNQCYTTGYFPTTWKRGLILPIKKPSKPENDKSSYRPITLLPCLGKLFEKIIGRRLEYFLESGNKLSNTQCGFRSKLSTIDVLLRVEHEIRGAIHNGRVCCVAYIDLKSAFDTVWRKGILYKLIRMGLKGKLFSILSSFLEDRTVKAVVGVTESDEKYTAAGTPQGAVLSPKLFNIFVNDIPICDDIKTHNFADDITITCTADTMADAKNKLQKYLNIFDRWTEDWGLLINPDKCVIQHYTKNPVSPPVLRIKNRIIKYSKIHTLLGMDFDSPRLKWDDHIKQLSDNILRRLDIMKALSSSCWGANAKVLRMFYVSYIRAKLDYGCVMYASANESMLNKLEVLQNRALRMILGARNTTPILSMQIESYLPPLKLRRAYLILRQYIRLRSSCNSQTKKLLGVDKDVNRVIYPKSFLEQCVYWSQQIVVGKIKNNQVTEKIIPPWQNVNEYIILNAQSNIPIDNNIKFLDYISENYSEYGAIYTDGSKVEGTEKSVSSAVYLPDVNRTICWKLHEQHSICAAELYALKMALKLLMSHDGFHRKYIIFTDSKTALQMVGGGNTGYSRLVNEIRLLLININQNKTVLLHWIKAHCGISGNEIADKAAHHGHSNNRSEWLDLFEYEYVSILKVKFKEHWTRYWHNTSATLGRGLHLRSITDVVEYNNLIYSVRNRRIQVLLHRFRMGHIGVLDYLHRFKMAEEPFCQNFPCYYSEINETIQHILIECPKYYVERKIFKTKVNALNVDFNLKNILLGNKSLMDKNGLILKYFIEFVNKIDRMKTYF